MFVYYDESILKYISSIRKYFGLNSSFNSDNKFDEILNKKNPKKIFLILIDGMGANLIERKLNADSFLRKNLFAKVTTVFPATTTAATTSIRNGKAPNENAWLSWIEYIKEVDDLIIPFKGVGFYSGIEYGDILNKYVKPTTTEDELNEKGVKSTSLFPSFIKGGFENLDDFKNRLIDYSKNEDYKYVYAYVDYYDTLMHKYGPDNLTCDELLKEINNTLESLADNIDEDTMLVITADHGQIKENRKYYFKGTKYEKYFYRKNSLEFRTVGFYIKDEYKDEFEKEFKNDFEDDAILLSKDDVLYSKLFGPHDSHPYFDSLLPDYVGICKSDLGFYYEKLEDELVGAHTGITNDELFIPLILYNK